MVHFGQVRDLARKELVECLDQYCGKKVTDLELGCNPSALSLSSCPLD